MGTHHQPVHYIRSCWGWEPVPQWEPTTDQCIYIRSCWGWEPTQWEPTTNQCIYIRSCWGWEPTQWEPTTDQCITFAPAGGESLFHNGNPPPTSALHSLLLGVRANTMGTHHRPVHYIRSCWGWEPVPQWELTTDQCITFAPAGGESQHNGNSPPTSALHSLLLGVRACSTMGTHHRPVHYIRSCWGWEPVPQWELTTDQCITFAPAGGESQHNGNSPPTSALHSLLLGVRACSTMGTHHRPVHYIRSCWGWEPTQWELTTDQCITFAPAGGESLFHNGNSPPTSALHSLLLGVRANTMGTHHRPVHLHSLLLGVRANTMGTHHQPVHLHSLLLGVRANTMGTHHRPVHLHSLLLGVRANTMGTHHRPVHYIRSCWGWEPVPQWELTTDQCITFAPAGGESQHNGNPPPTSAFTFAPAGGESQHNGNPPPTSAFTFAPAGGESQHNGNPPPTSALQQWLSHQQMGW